MIAEDMRGWLPSQHAAWMVLAAVGRLDLSRFHAAYRADGQGQVPYDPAMMLAVVYYCGLKGITSTRKLREACTDDVGARLIAGGAVPSNKAFADFKRRHQDAIRELFAQVLALLRAEGVIGEDDDVAAIDGSPVSTAAALGSNMTAAQLEKEITAARQHLDAEAEAWAAANAAAGTQETLWDGDDQDQDGGGGPGLPPGAGRKLAAAHRRVARLEAARDRLQERAAAGPGGAALARLARARDKAAAAGARLAARVAAADEKMARYQARLEAGKAWAGKKPVPADRNAMIARDRKNAATAQQRLAGAEAAAAAIATRVSATDPDSRILPGKNGGWVQGVNFQASAGRSQVLYAPGTHDSPADAGALIPMIRATDASCDDAGIARKPVKLADSGYASQDTFAQLADGSSGHVLVAVSKEAVQAGRRGPAGTRPVPGPWQDMAARLADPANKQLYKKRGQYVEPFFAQMFQRNGRRIPYRGTAAITAELALRGQIHNLAKLFTHWTRTGKPVPVPA